MPRPKSDVPTTQIALRLPTAWLTWMDALARQLSRPGIPVTRSDALRAVMIKGLELLRAEEAAKKAPKEAAKKPPKRAPRRGPPPRR